MNAIFAEIDQKIERVQSLIAQHPQLSDDFQKRLLYSWIYHDNAIEGVALSYHELNSSIDDDIVSDVSLIPAYEEIQNHKKAVAMIRAGIEAKKKPSFDLDYLKDLQVILSYESNPPRQSKSAPKIQPGQYRKDNPLHRLYYHEISPPEKITYQMRKFMDWMVSDEAKKMHAIPRAAIAHHRLITIFPWPKHSGKVARLLMNAMLLRDGYMPAVIHGVNRQRYYEVLRQAPDGLIALVTESEKLAIASALEYFAYVVKQR